MRAVAVRPDAPGPPGARHSRHVVESFQFATQGLVYALRTQRNLRIHFFIALLVVLLALAVEVRRSDLAILVLAIVVVLAAELANTAIEAAVDIMSPQVHELARIAKNVAAGGVMVSAIGAVGVGLLVFYGPLTRILTYGGPLPTRGSDAYLTVGGTALVLLVTWGAKTALTRPVQLSGGMPSGHAAVAFALATAVFFVSRSALVTLAGIALAVLVGQSRLEGGLHTPSQVVVGGALGAVIMALVFWLLGR